MDWLALISALFFAVGCAPLAFFQAACPCCGIPCTPCTGGTMPAQVQVVVSGVTNASCVTCASLDGTFILDATDGGAAPCIWTLLYSAVCGPSEFTACTVNLGNTGITFNHVRVGQDLTWSSTSAGFANCSGWSSFSLAPLFTTPTCDNASATCFLTTL